MRAVKKRVVAVVVALGAGAFVAGGAGAGCKIEPYKAPDASATADGGDAGDAGVYDCTKFDGYKKLCPNDPSPIESPRRQCENRVRHAKCGDLGAAVMECLWQLQSRKDMCGADGVTISGKVILACGDENDAEDSCRAQNP